MESKGTVIAVLEPKSGTSAAGKEWRNQTFVIETDGAYPKKQAFSVFGVDKTIPNVGDEVNVSFEFQSREYQGNWFSEGRCFKLEIVGKQAPTTVTAYPEKSTTEPPF